MNEASVEQVVSVVHEELSSPVTVAVGGKTITVTGLKRRWQALFRKAALPLFRAELAATEDIQKSIADGTINFKNISELLINSEIESDEALDGAAAVILASQVPGAEKTPDATIAEQRNWIMDNSNTAELRALVEAQASRERLIEEVGERWPARLARSARLAGDAKATADSVRQVLTNSSQRSLPTPDGAGSSTTPSSGG